MMFDECRRCTSLANPTAPTFLHITLPTNQFLESPPSLWMTRFLYGAGFYHLLLGCAFLFRLDTSLLTIGSPVAKYAALGTVAGILAASLGIGLLAASLNPLRHWPIALVGCLGYAGLATALPIAWIDGRVPMGFLVTSTTISATWSVSFGLILYSAYRNHLNLRRQSAPEVQQMALRIPTNKGTPLLEMSRHSPLLLVFLRHSGCPFCREALSDIAHQKRRIEASGTQVVLIHMGADPAAHEFFQRYGLAGVPRVSDSNRTLYRAFDLGRGGLWQVFGPNVWWRGFQAAILRRNGIAWPVKDVFQMPGVFLIFHGQVLRSFLHNSSADRPNYAKMVEIDGFDYDGAIAS